MAPSFALILLCPTTGIARLLIPVLVVDALLVLCMDNNCYMYLGQGLCIICCNFECFGAALALDFVLQQGLPACGPMGQGLDSIC